MSTVARTTVGRDGVARLAAELAPPPPSPAIAEQVAAIVAQVRAMGDDALVEMTRRFDAPTFVPEQIRVPRDAIDAALDGSSTEFRDAVMVAAEQVRELAIAIRPSDTAATLPHGQRITVRVVPVEAAGIYVPGGRAAYPSSLVMAVVPAQVAGVERIAVVSPPDTAGEIAAPILAAAALLGVDEIYAVGGPAAVAALAYGTQTIRPVSVIAGPGSSWVQEAKRQVFGTVGIDGIAGPSEVVIVADGPVDAEALAADLCAQAEHGPDSPAILISPDPAVLDAVDAALSEHEVAGAITLIGCDSLDVALLFTEAFAPEHLQLVVDGAERLAGHIRNAGAVFLGRNGATAFGDYVAGSNHILPTGRAARFASAVSPVTFMRRMSVVDLPDAAVTALTPSLATIATAEGFPHHRRSAEIRAARIDRAGAQ